MRTFQRAMLDHLRKRFLVGQRADLRRPALWTGVVLALVATLGLTTQWFAVEQAEAAVDRPDGNTGTGFFVRDGEVYDPDGNVYRIRGLNHTHWWGSNNEAAIKHIAKAQPNTVRAVFGSGMGADTPAEQRSVIEQYIDYGITPMVEYHDATCDKEKADLDAVVDLWLDPDRVAYLQEFEREVILNIANEWGPKDETWRDAYKDAITRLRDAGINNMLVIDAGGNCGQNPRAVQNYGQDLLDHDPQQNVLFSVHMYGFWRTEERADEVGSWGDGPFDIATELEEIKENQDLPLIVGEFSWSTCDSVEYDTKSAVQIFEELEIGWLAWSWNQNSNDCLDMAVDYKYNSDDDLTDWGDFIVNDSTYGLKALAQQPTPTTTPDPAASTTPSPSATSETGSLPLDNGVYLPLITGGEAPDPAPEPTAETATPTDSPDSSPTPDAQPSPDPSPTPDSQPSPDPSPTPDNGITPDPDFRGPFCTDDQTPMIIGFDTSAGDPNDTLAEVRQYSLEAVNYLRWRTGLPPLQADAALDDIGERALAADNGHGYFRENCMNAKYGFGRNCEAGWAQENIGWASGSSRTWKDGVRVPLCAMMEEPRGVGHRANIESEEWTRMGIGIEYDANGAKWYHEFGR